MSVWLLLYMYNRINCGYILSYIYTYIHMCMCMYVIYWGEPEQAPHRSVVDACVVHTSLAQKFTLRTRKAPHWSVVNAYIVHTSHARRSTI